ncbi:MAG: TetR family transcriptional regulator [Candidatus Krumholzibacteriia bacterium]
MPAPLDRDQILDEAIHVFARLGLRKASIGDIVAPFGVGKTAIYHHFPGGKNEIIDACLAREEEAILAGMRAAVDRHQDPRDQLRAMVSAKLAHIERLRAVHAITGDAGREIGHLYRSHQRRFTLHEESLIETILRRGQDMGVFRTGGAQRLARGLRGLLAQVELEIAFDAGSGTSGDELDTVFDLLFHGLVAPGQREGSPS